MPVERAESKWFQAVGDDAYAFRERTEKCNFRPAIGYWQSQQGGYVSLLLIMSHVILLFFETEIPNFWYFWDLPDYFPWI